MASRGGNVTTTGMLSAAARNIPRGFALDCLSVASRSHLLSLQLLVRAGTDEDAEKEAKNVADAQRLPALPSTSELYGGWSGTGFDIEEWYERYKAAVTVQRIVRGALARHRCIVPSRRRAQLQAEHTRSRRRVDDQEGGERMKLQEQYQQLEHRFEVQSKTKAATMLQSARRGELERRWLAETEKEVRGKRLHTAALWIQSTFRGHQGRKTYRAMRRRAGLAAASQEEHRRDLRTAENRGRGGISRHQQLAREGLVESHWYERQQVRRRQHPGYTLSIEEDGVRGIAFVTEKAERMLVGEDRGRGGIVLEEDLGLGSMMGSHGRFLVEGTERFLRNATHVQQRGEVRDLRIDLVVGRVEVRELLGRRRVGAEERGFRSEINRAQRHAYGLAQPHSQERVKEERAEKRCRRVVSDEEEREREALRPLYLESRETCAAAERKRMKIHYTARQMLADRESVARAEIDKVEHKAFAKVAQAHEEQSPGVLYAWRERLRRERCERVAVAAAEHFARREPALEEAAERAAQHQVYLAELGRLLTEVGRARTLRMHAVLAHEDIERGGRARVQQTEKRDRAGTQAAMRWRLRRHAEFDQRLRAQWAKEQNVVIYEEGLPRKRVWGAEVHAWEQLLQQKAADWDSSKAAEHARLVVEGREQQALADEEAEERRPVAVMEADWFLPMVEAQELDWRPFNEYRESVGRTFVLQAARIDAAEIGARPDVELAEFQSRVAVRDLADRSFATASVQTDHRNKSLRRLVLAFTKTEDEARGELARMCGWQMAQVAGEEIKGLHRVQVHLQHAERVGLGEEESQARGREQVSEQSARRVVWLQRGSEVAHWLGVHAGEEQTATIRPSQLWVESVCVAERETRAATAGAENADRTGLAHQKVQSLHTTKMAILKRERAAQLWHSDFMRAEINNTRVRKRKELAHEEWKTREEEMQDEQSDFKRILWQASERHRLIIEEQMAVIEEESCLRDAMDDEEEERYDRVVSSYQLGVELIAAALQRKAENDVRILRTAERVARITIDTDEITTLQRRYGRFRRRVATTFWEEAADAWEPGARQIHRMQERDRADIVFRYTVRVGALAAAPPAEVPYRPPRRRMPSIAPMSMASPPRQRAPAPTSQPLRPGSRARQLPLTGGRSVLSPQRRPDAAGRFGVQVQRPARGPPEAVPVSVVRTTSQQAVQGAMNSALNEISQQLGEVRERDLGRAAGGEYHALSEYFSQLGRGLPILPKGSKRAAGPTQDEFALLLRIAAAEGSSPDALKEAIGLWNDARGAVLEGRVGTDNHVALLLIAAAEEGAACPAIAEVMAHTADLRCKALRGRRATMNELALLFAAGVEPGADDAGSPLAALHTAAAAVGTDGALADEGDAPTPLKLGALLAAGGDEVQAAVAEAARGFGLGDIHRLWCEILSDEADGRVYRQADECLCRRQLTETHETGLRQGLSVERDRSWYECVGDCTHVTSAAAAVSLFGAAVRAHVEEEAEEADARGLLRRAHIRGCRKVAAVYAANRTGTIGRREGKRGIAAHCIQRAWRYYAARRERRAAAAVAMDEDLLSALSEEALLTDPTDVTLEEEAERGVTVIEEEVVWDRLERARVSQLDAILKAEAAMPFGWNGLIGVQDEEGIGRAKLTTLREQWVLEAAVLEQAERQAAPAPRGSLDSSLWQRPRGRSIGLSEMELYDMLRRIVREEIKGRLHLEDAEFGDRSEVGGRWRTQALVASCYSRAEDGDDSIQSLCRKISWMDVQPLHVKTPGGPPPLRRPRGIQPRIMESRPPSAPRPSSRDNRFKDPVVLEELRSRGGAGRLAMLETFRKEGKNGPNLPAIEAAKEPQSTRLSRALQRGIR